MAHHDMAIEIRRKLIHLSSLWIVLYLYFGDKEQVVLVLLLLFSMMLLYDVLRYFSVTKAMVSWIGSGVLRQRERTGFRLTGASWMLLAGTLCCAFFSQYIAFAAMLILIVSDTCAALIGRRWGSIPLLDKSLQGSAAFFISAWLCLALTAVLFQLSVQWWLLSAMVALLATGVELIAGKIRVDDNLSIPLSVALSLLLLSHMVPKL